MRSTSVVLALGLCVLCVAGTGCVGPPAPSPRPTGPPPATAPPTAIAAPTPAPTRVGVFVTTIAGTCYPTARDYVDGQGGQARFCKPCGLGLDAEGNLLVADCFNHCIRRVSLDGTVTRVAGACGEKAGYVDGASDVARFFWPTHAIGDSSGRIYVADSYNDSIRVVQLDGTVSTLAGGVVGYRDGRADQARFGRPNGLVMDAAGNLLVADLDNNCIRKISPAGDVTTIAGAEERAYADGPALLARFGAPNSLAFDAQGNLYIAEGFYGHNLPGWPRVRKMSPDGMVTTVAGSGERGYRDGPADLAQFDFPMGPSIDKWGNIYVGDDFNHCIRVIRPDGHVETLAGTVQHGNADGPVELARFDHPVWTVIGPDGALYVADSGNNCIRKIALSP